jgi:WD40 repeat protein
MEGNTSPESIRTLKAHSFRYSNNETTCPNGSTSNASKNSVLRTFSASSVLIDTVKSHEGALWSMHVRPDGKALVTSSADKDIKFEEIEMDESF